MKTESARQFTSEDKRGVHPAVAAVIGRPSIAQAAVVALIGLGLGVVALAVATLPSHWAPLFALAAISPFVAFIVGNPRRLLLAAVVLDVPFSVGTHLGYNVDAAKLGSLGGLNVSITTLALPLLFGLWIADLVSRRGDRALPLIRPALPLIVYVGFAIVSTHAAQVTTLSIFELFMLVQSLVLFVYVASTVRSRDDLVFVAVVLSASVALESVAMLATGLTGHDFSFAGISTRIDPTNVAAQQVSRIGGTMGGPNAAAAFLGLLLAPTLSLLLAPVRARYRLIAAAAFGLGAVALVLTMSRGGWIAFGLSTSIVLAYAVSRRRISPLVLAGGLVAAGVALFVFRDQVLLRFFTDDAGSADSRIPLMRLALHMIADHPLWGVGANNFGSRIADYATPEFGADWLYTVHNKYLLVWAEDGIFALIAFVTFLLLTLRRGWHARAIADPVIGLLAVGLTAGFLGQMIHMGVDILNGRPQVQALWLVAALLVAAERMYRARLRPLPRVASRWATAAEPRERRVPRRISVRGQDERRTDAEPRGQQDEAGSW